jgi:hypothetical protein
MKAVTFNSKETYLQYRTDWKRRYASLSQTIRDLKYCRKYSSFGTDRYLETKKTHETTWGFFPQSLAWRHRQQASAMLEELKEAKAEAQRQYVESKAKSLEHKELTRS